MRTKFVKTCEHCGVNVKLVAHKTTMRDKDDLRCPHCGKVLISWNGAVFYSLDES